MFRKSLLAVAVAAVAACGGAGTPASNADVGKGDLTGAGSTFVQPFFLTAFYAYNHKYPGVKINYQGVGSGAGIKQFQAGTVDFGASDVPMKASEITAAGGDSSLVQIPVALGAVAVAYNLPGVDSLQLDGPTLADIFLGKVKKWNDPEIAALNSGVTLPAIDISVAHRSDGSGTTYIFTDYLSKVSDTWKSQVGTSKSVNWPVGVGAKGTAGVAGTINQTKGAIGYVELAYALQGNMQQVELKNQAGKFLKASVVGATAAAAQAANLSATDFSIVNEPGDNSYPIVGYTWAFLRTSIDDLSKAKALVFLFKWVESSDGQAQGKALDYAPLPTPAQSYALDQLKKVQSGGKTVLS